MLPTGVFREILANRGVLFGDIEICQKRSDIFFIGNEKHVRRLHQMLLRGYRLGVTEGLREN